MNGQNLNHEQHFLHALKSEHQYGITMFNDKTIIYKVEGDKIQMHVDYEPLIKEMVSETFYKQHIKFIV